MLSDDELGKLLCEALRNAFAEKLEQYSGKSREERAQEIGVTRQAFESYGRPLRTPLTPAETGSIPRGHILLLALLRWEGFEISLDVPGVSGPGGHWIFKATRQNRRTVRRPAEQLLLPLEEAIDDLGSDNVEVRIVRKGPNSIDLGVEIAFRKRSA